jgi:hypothetical protein
MKRLFATICALGLMGIMLRAGLRGPASTAPAVPDLGRYNAADRPRAELSGVTDRIEAWLDCARRGDVSGYLASCLGPLRSRLERQADEVGRVAFAEDLRRTAGVRKSHALFEPEPDAESSDGARIVVESTFADRIERQTCLLSRQGSTWLIRDVETAKDRLPPKPLGSLASFEEPEGVPVPVSPREVGRENASMPQP